MGRRKRRKGPKRSIRVNKRRLAGGVALGAASVGGYKLGTGMMRHGFKMLGGGVPGATGGKALGLLVGGYGVASASGYIAGEGLIRAGTSFSRTGPIKRKGRGGAKKGHPFFGNQYTKVAKYARRGISRARSHVSRHRKKYSRGAAVGLGLAGAAVVSKFGGVRTTPKLIGAG
jgi:hypothetical protein